jgi:hypothetical protein
VSLHVVSCALMGLDPYIQLRFLVLFCIVLGKCHENDEFFIDPHVYMYLFTTIIRIAH